MRGFASRQIAGQQSTALPQSPVRLGRSDSKAERDAERVADHGSGQVADGGHRDGTFAPATLAGHATPATQTPRDLFPHDGKPLDALTRNQMESRFQFDFSRVRIHHDEEASRAATALSARAFTLGNDIA